MDVKKEEKGGKKMNKRCIINFFSTGREDYQRGTERLISCVLTHNMDVDVIVHSPDFTEDAEIIRKQSKITMIKGYPITQKYGEGKPHSEAPYQFKAYCFQHALELGYKEILWCDSSIVILKNPEHYWKLAEEIGVILFDNQGCLESTWTSDDCLNQMGCDPEYAKTFFQCDAGIMMLNFNNPKTNIVFDEYMKYCNDGICLKGASGSTRPDFTAHRHDQSVISYIAKKNYINFINYGGWVYGGDPGVKEGRFNPTFAKLGIRVPASEINSIFG